MRVTAAEATELRERAQAARLSMGAYLRRRALGQRMRIAAEWRLGATELRLGAAELRELNTHLASGSGLIHRGRQGKPSIVVLLSEGSWKNGKTKIPWRPMKQNWKNRTMWTGDNLPVLRGMNSGCVDLIYLDPPFNSNRNYSAPIGSKAAGAAFKDTWTLDDVDVAWHGEIAEQNPAVYAAIGAAGEAHGKGMKSYLIMMAVRLMEIHRLLTPTGSLYLHCDPTASHYLKTLMDAIFGPRQFRNEVVWKRTSSHNRAKRWGPIHDTILFYSAGSKFTWNRVLQPLDAAYVENFYRHKDGKGRYRVSDLTGPGLRDGDTGQPWQDIDPASRSRHWELPPDHALPEWFTFPNGYADMLARERLDVLNKQGLIYWPAKQGGVPGFKRYLGAHSGSPVQDLILDIKPLSAAA